MLMLYEYMNNGNCNIFFSRLYCIEFPSLLLVLTTRKMLVSYVPQCVCDLLNKQRIHICFLQVLVIIY